MSKEKDIQYTVNKTGCWNCISHHLRDGYPVKDIRQNGIHYTMQMARFIWMGTTKELLPEGVDVLHKCDNRLCINMEHLFLGNDKLNVLDKCVKGRQARGETLSNLTSHKVELMRYCRENTNFTLAKIGELFGVNPRSVHSIISRRTWKHLL